MNSKLSYQSKNLNSINNNSAQRSNSSLSTKKFKLSKSSFAFDHWILFATLGILFIGLIVLASASSCVADQYYHGPLRFITRQISYYILAIIICLMIIKRPITFWKNTCFLWLMLACFLLILVLIPGIGKEINGSMRWIGFSVLRLQPSEIAKLSVIIFIANYLVRREFEVQYMFSGFLNPMIIIGFIAVLLLKEPDFGATVVIATSTLLMLFIAGARLLPFIMILLVAITSFVGLAISSPYRLARMTSFLDPWSSAYGSGYQLTQSLIAFGRGGIFGAGLGNSVQKLFYLPEAHTDFLFAILAEEFGIFGQFIVLGLFAIIIGRAFYLGKTALAMKEKFSAYLAYGFGLLLGLQVFVNIGVNTGILPTKGLTLPFMSYGGSSILFNCIIIAILLRISHEIRLQQHA